MNTKRQISYVLCSVLALAMIMTSCNNDDEETIPDYVGEWETSMNGNRNGIDFTNSLKLKLTETTAEFDVWESSDFGSFLVYSYRADLTVVENKINYDLNYVRTYVGDSTDLQLLKIYKNDPRWEETLSAHSLEESFEFTYTVSGDELTLSDGEFEEVYTRK